MATSHEQNPFLNFIHTARNNPFHHNGGEKAAVAYREAFFTLTPKERIDLLKRLRLDGMQSDPLLRELYGFLIGAFTAEQMNAKEINGLLEQTGQLNDIVTRQEGELKRAQIHLREIEEQLAQVRSQLALLRIQEEDPEYIGESRRMTEGITYTSPLTGWGIQYLGNLDPSRHSLDPQATGVLTGHTLGYSVAEKKMVFPPLEQEILDTGIAFDHMSVTGELHKGVGSVGIISLAKQRGEPHRLILPLSAEHDSALVRLIRILPQKPMRTSRSEGFAWWRRDISEPLPTPPLEIKTTLFVRPERSAYGRIGCFFFQEVTDFSDELTEKRYQYDL